MGHAVDQHLLSLVHQDLKELITKHRKTEADVSVLRDQQSSAKDQLEKHDEQFEGLLKENEDTLERLVSVEETWHEELQSLQTDVRQLKQDFVGVESKLCQTGEGTKQFKCNVGNKMLKRDWPCWFIFPYAIGLQI